MPIAARQLLRTGGWPERIVVQALTWSGGTLTFSIGIGTNANGLQAMLPRTMTAGSLSADAQRQPSLTRNDDQGHRYVLFNARARHVSSNLRAVEDVTRRSQRFEIFDEVECVLIAQPEIEHLVVMLHDGEQRRETPVVIEPALLVAPESLQRRRAVPMVGRAVGLKIVDANLSPGVHRPAWFREERRHVARRTPPSTVENRLPVIGRTRIEGVGGRRRRWHGELVKL